MTSAKFSIGLLDKYHLFIPEIIYKPFADAKQSRVKLVAEFNGNRVDFYAAVKRCKNTGDYKLMFGNQLQKKLGVVMNDYFDIQIFEDTSKYGVEMPEEFEAVLKSDHEAFEIFKTLTAGKKRSAIYAIIRIKNSQSRIDKALIFCENLKRGITDLKLLFKTSAF